MKTWLHNLCRNAPREGGSYLAFQLGGAIIEHLERLAAGVVSSHEVSDLLATAFPGQALSMDRLGKQDSTRRESRGPERQLRAMRRRSAPWIYVAKTLIYLLFYYGGLFQLVRALRRTAKTSRACVLLYHRVNDLSDDPLTTSVGRFAEQMILLRKYYTVLPSSLLVAKLETGQPLPSNTVAIHFDDCYRDVSTHAWPVLAALGFPALALVSSGYVGTERQFPHDGSSPWVFGNLRPEDLREMAATCFEIGSHTVNHVDLARCTDEAVVEELTQSKRELEAIIGRPVTLFSFPFGREKNRHPRLVPLVKQAGYLAMFSAYGGLVTGRSDVFDLPRVGVSGDTRPIDLLMEIEGLPLGAIRRWWRARHSHRESSSTPARARA